MSTLIIDGNPLVWKLVTTKKMESVRYPYFFAVELLRYYREMNSDRCVIVFDGGGSVYRTNIDSNYKRNRHDTPDRIAVRAAMREIMRVFDHFPRVIKVDGVEADDIISIIAHRHSMNGVKATIVSRDRDLWQCLSPVVSMCEGPGHDVVTDSELRRYGGSRGFIIHKALCGDAGDNIPGIKGIGEERATEIVNFARKNVPLGSEKMQRLLEYKKWAKVLTETDFRSKLSKQVALVTTVVDPNQLGDRGVEVAKKVDRALLPYDDVVDRFEWCEFLRSNNLLAIVGAEHVVAKILGVQIK